MRNELGTYILFVIAVYISGAISWLNKFLNNFSFVFWTIVVAKDTFILLLLVFNSNVRQEFRIEII